MKVWIDEFGEFNATSQAIADVGDLVFSAIIPDLMRANILEIVIRAQTGVSCFNSAREEETVSIARSTLTDIFSLSPAFSETRRTRLAGWLYKKKMAEERDELAAIDLGIDLKF